MIEHRIGGVCAGGLSVGEEGGENLFCLIFIHGRRDRGLAARVQDVGWTVQSRTGYFRFRPDAPFFHGCRVTHHISIGGGFRA